MPGSGCGGGPGNVGGHCGGVVDARHRESVQALDFGVEPVEVGETCDGVGRGGLPAFGDGRLDVVSEFPGVQADPAFVVQGERRGTGELVPQGGELMYRRDQVLSKDARSRPVYRAMPEMAVEDW